VTLTLEPLPADEYATWRAALLERRVSWRRHRGLDPAEVAQRVQRFVEGFLPADGPPGNVEVLVVMADGVRRGSLFLLWVTPEAVQLGDLVVDAADAAGVCRLVVERLESRGAGSLGVGMAADDPAGSAFVAGRSFEPVATQMQLDLAATLPRPDGSRVRSRPMTTPEVDAYLARAVEEYAAETMAADALLTREAALENSRQVHAQALPQGAGTPGHDFLVAEDTGDGRRVGMLWLFHEERAGYVYDVAVDEDERGRGYGRAVMELADRHCRDLGLEVLGLNVFGHNAVARGLYDSLGYEVVDQSLKLRLSPR
jgi:GNAT superfamily N-acetyltransferase